MLIRGLPLAGVLEGDTPAARSTPGSNGPGRLRRPLPTPPCNLPVAPISQWRSSPARPSAATPLPLVEPPPLVRCYPPPAPPPLDLLYDHQKWDHPQKPRPPPWPVVTSPPAAPPIVHHEACSWVHVDSALR